MKRNFILASLMTAACALTAPGQSNEERARQKVLEEKVRAEAAMRTKFDVIKMTGATAEVDVMMSGAVVRGAPYSAVASSTSTQTLPDGNRITRTTQLRVFRDSEGRTRREQDLSSFGPWKASASVVAINDPVAATRYTLYPEKQIAEKQFKIEVDGNQDALKQEAREKLEAELRQKINRTVIVEPRQQVAKKESLGERSVEGVVARGTRTVETIPAGEIGNERPIEVVSESWYSEELRAVVLSKRSDPRVGETEYKLTQIQRAEQPRHLFEVPGNYTVKGSGGGEILKR